jgi:cyclic pyranopterin phosphate synthase
MIYDNYGRPLLNLRISVTQRCNLNCPYCHREGEPPSKTVSSRGEMTAEEIIRLTKIAVGLGISRVKLTGGEPLLRKDILDIVEGIANLRGLKDLSMTTNGVHLAFLAKDLKQKGLMRVNISLPSLNPKTYHTLMNGELLEVLKGVKTAVDVGLHPVKLNMLILKGINDNEIQKMIGFAEHSGTILQLIELEPVNISRDYYEQHHFDLDAIQKQLKEHAFQVKTRKHMQNRKVYFLPKTKVEIVKPIENTEFCKRCTRLRITSDGKLKPCLMRNDNLVDILGPLRNGANDKKLESLFIEACKRRKPYWSSK